MKILSAGCIILFFIFMNVNIYAQKYGLQGGVNISNMIIKDNETTYGADKQVGFNIGITIDFNISKLAELEVGIIYESRGAKIEDVGIIMTYMDVPLLLKVGPTIGRVKIYGAAGPYVGTGLSGFFDSTFEGKQYTYWFGWGKDAFLRRLDYGTKFGVGIQDVHLNLGVYYSLGIANISAVRDNGIVIRNNGISICIGYMF
jgi:hypothetical protein